MKKCRTMFVLAVFLLSAANPVFSREASSILAVQATGPGRVKKIQSSLHSTRTQLAIASQNTEQLQYRNFTILMNPLSDGTYEVHAFRLVKYGNRRVSSVFSSLYRSSVEYGYRFDQGNNKILRYHFLFPPNSLTGWANPQDYAAMSKFDWGEAFPARNCANDTFIHTLEEFGREYLEAACMPDRATALRFVRKFVDYMHGNRGI